jgi:hypothetical protein
MMMSAFCTPGKFLSAGALVADPRGVVLEISGFTPDFILRECEDEAVVPCRVSKELCCASVGMMEDCREAAEAFEECSAAVRKRAIAKTRGIAFNMQFSLNDWEGRLD